MRRFVLLVWSANGLILYGPFDTLDQAEDWGEAEIGGRSHWMAIPINPVE